MDEVFLYHTTSLTEKMLTESRTGNYISIEFAAHPCAMGQKDSLGVDDPHIPPGKPWPHHLLGGGPHTWRPTAEPSG